MTALGLGDHQVTPSQASASPTTVAGNSLGYSPSSSAAYHGGKPSPSSLQNTVQAAHVERRGLAPKSPAHLQLGASGHRGLPPSPSFSQYRNRTSSGKPPAMADLPFANSPWIDETIGEKRSRGLSNLFKPRSASKTSGRGETKSRKW